MMLRKATKNLLLSMLFAALSGLAIALIPLTDVFGQGAEKVLSPLVAALFWLSLILEQVFFWIGNHFTRQIRSRTGDPENSRLIGLVAFCTSREAMVADIVLALSVIGCVVLSFLRIGANWPLLTCIGIALSTFHFHCILNGKTYRYIKNLLIARSNQRASRRKQDEEV